MGRQTRKLQPLTAVLGRTPWVVFAWLGAACYLGLRSLAALGEATGHDDTHALPSGVARLADVLQYPLPALLLILAVRAFVRRQRPPTDPR